MSYPSIEQLGATETDNLVLALPKENPESDQAYPARSWYGARGRF